ncbi:MAG: 3'-5' exonuclease [Anaerolineaceae bacterium]|nr:3'-5' exonuclease [Anaerolineaceae bacterium]
MSTNPIRDELPAYISVDVETSGPVPEEYALLSIGACTLDGGERFYVELQPTSLHAQAEAMRVHGLSLERLAQEGLPPQAAMARLDAWLAQAVPAGEKPIFVAFNAAFDWMFVNQYFLRYLGHNPFGHSALDIKAVYMGAFGVPWRETSYRHIARLDQDLNPLSHHALDDALQQARLFRLVLQRLIDRPAEGG